MAIPIISNVGVIPGETVTNTEYDNRMSLYDHEIPQTILSYDIESSNYILNDSVLKITAVSGAYTPLLVSENAIVSISLTSPGKITISQAPEWELSTYDLVESGPINLSPFTANSKTNLIADNEGSYMWCYKGGGENADKITYVALDDIFYGVGASNLAVVQALQDGPVLIDAYGPYQTTQASAVSYSVSDGIASITQLKLIGDFTFITDSIIAKTVASTETDYLDKTERNLVNIIPIIMILGVLVTAGAYYIRTRID